MTASEWLGVMQKAQDFPKGMEKLIIKYGEMLIEEHKLLSNKCDDCHGDIDDGICFCNRD